MTTHRERRIVARRPADIQVHVIGPGGRETILLSRDWSSTGVFLRTVAPFPEGTRVAMSTVLGQPPERIHLSGVVVRVDLQRHPSAREPCGMAVALDALPQNVRDILDGNQRRRRLG